jgi:uncharacterized membrane protein
MIIRYALIALNAAGFLLSVYFTLLVYGLLPPDMKHLPRFCRMNTGECQSILHTSYARLFVLPNSLLGMVYYAAIVLVVLTSSPPLETVIYRMAVAASFVSVLISVYLAFVLFARLKVRCVLCLTSHLLNLCNFILLMIVPGIP